MQAIDARRLFLGAAGAAALGLALGGLFRPSLALQAGAQVMTPQPQAQFDEAAPAVAYNGRTPDYVIGTDWLPRNDASAARVIARAVPSAAYDAQAVTTTWRAPPVDYAEAHSADDDSAAPETVIYPSEGGGIVAGSYSAEPESSAPDEGFTPPPAA